MKVKGATLIQHSSALASYLGNEEARGAFSKGNLSIPRMCGNTHIGSSSLIVNSESQIRSAVKFLSYE
jgi:hypothetical protein